MKACKNIKHKCTSQRSKSPIIKHQILKGLVKTRKWCHNSLQCCAFYHLILVNIQNLMSPLRLRNSNHTTNSYSSSAKKKEEHDDDFNWKRDKNSSVYSSEKPWWHKIFYVIDVSVNAAQAALEQNSDIHWVMNTPTNWCLFQSLALIKVSFLSYQVESYCDRDRYTIDHGNEKEGRKMKKQGQWFSLQWQLLGERRFCQTSAVIENYILYKACECRIVDNVYVVSFVVSGKATTVIFMFLMITQWCTHLYVFFFCSSNFSWGCFFKSSWG